MRDSSSNPKTRASLLLRILDSQDKTAWTTFVDTYAPLVYRYCRRRGLQDSDAQDVTQDVLAQVLKSAHDFIYRPERGRFRDWLYRVTYTKIADHLEAMHRAGRAAGTATDLIPGAVAPAAPSSEWIEEFDMQMLRVALSRTEQHFEPETWSAFVLSWEEGNPAREVAQKLGIEVDKVYVAKSRVVARLREEVLSLAGDHPVYNPLC